MLHLSMLYLEFCLKLSKLHYHFLILNSDWSVYPHITATDLKLQLDKA